MEEKRRRFSLDAWSLMASTSGTTPAGYTQTGDPDAVVNNRTNVTLAPGDVYVNADFGYRPTTSSTIGDLVFLDPNGNGTQDANEPGVPGVTVTLLNAGGFVVATTTTDAFGNTDFTSKNHRMFTIDTRAGWSAGRAARCRERR